MMMLRHQTAATSQSQTGLAVMSCLRRSKHSNTQTLTPSLGQGKPHVIWQTCLLVSCSSCYSSTCLDATLISFAVWLLISMQHHSSSNTVAC